jgi:hypothetical protein
MYRTFTPDQVLTTVEAAVKFVREIDSYYVLPIHISRPYSEPLKGSPLNPELEVSGIGRRTRGGGIERFLHCLMSLP